MFSRWTGYEDTDEAERRCIDPTMRQVVGGRASGTTQFPRTSRNAFIVTPRKLLILGLRGGVKKIGKYLGSVEA